MRRIPTPGKRFPFQLYFPDLDEIDRICLIALQQRGLLPETPEPIRIDRFIEKHFDCPIAFEDFAEEILGCCVFSPFGAVQQIIVSRQLAEDERLVAQRRLRSTYAHEAGHGLLHGCLFIEEGTGSLFDHEQTKAEGRRFLCRPEDIGELTDRCYDGKWWEFQANRAIGGLLLPKALVAEAAKPFAREVPPLGAWVLDEPRREDAVKALARTFDVNLAAVRFRLQEIFTQNPLQNLR